MSDLDIRDQIRVSDRRIVVCCRWLLARGVQPTLIERYKQHLLENPPLCEHIFGTSDTRQIPSISTSSQLRRPNTETPLPKRVKRRAARRVFQKANAAVSSTSHLQISFRGVTTGATSSSGKPCPLDLQLEAISRRAGVSDSSSRSPPAKRKVQWPPGLVAVHPILVSLASSGKQQKQPSSSHEPGCMSSERSSV
eukprot:TRINITY_DN12776_c0_g1_i1.p1 TRINITY_DN12776_c0_g1~~TRINITY_DN12776_c0_g1_i1.p1  ORF type:complete len:195 (+),score=0.09 TRINITY_DN12776_c0_g1_i1:20-604(+)